MSVGLLYLIPTLFRFVAWCYDLILSSAYTPQVGFDEEVKKRFREDLDEVVRVILHSEKLVISGDFNGHTELATSSFDGVYGGFGFGVRNKGGVSLLDFAKAFELGDRGICKNCKVIPSENLSIQHKLLAINLEFKREGKKKKTSYDRLRVKLGGLTPTKAWELGERLMVMGDLGSSRDANNMWEK
ncbi:hypothetical protein KY289_015438 [Solanum tuberosum]|nr:hypothetical protein KY289_015438 [Solanum tuberosum]